MKPTPLVAALALALGTTLPASVNAATEFSISRTAQFVQDCGDNGESCTEISDYSKKAGRLYVTNATQNKLLILNLDAASGALDVPAADGDLPAEIDLSPYGGGPNSVAVYGDWVAVAVEADNKQADGKVVIFDLDGNHKRTLRVGALPDMLTFTPDGRYLLVANEGEPNDNYTVDPEGSISVINTRSWRVHNADFRLSNWRNQGNDHAGSRTIGFNGQGEAKGSYKAAGDIRVFGPNASFAQDMEPEYIAVSADSRTAWVSLQENNALAIIDIEKAKVIDVVSLGYKDHLLAGNSLDVSDEDDGINMANWPVLGTYMPDAIAAYTTDAGETYILSANEGDSRDYAGYSEEARVKDLELDPEAFAGYDIEQLQKKKNLGRLKVTTSQGDIDGDGDYDQLYAYGARSFSVWDSEGKQVWDSGNQFETLLAKYTSEDGLDVWVDSRSDDKGPEPESVVVGTLSGVPYAFIGLERTSGIFIYDLSNPTHPTAAGFMDIEAMGDTAPEGLKFIQQGDDGLLVVTSEVSNTVSVYRVSATH